MRLKPRRVLSSLAGFHRECSLTVFLRDQCLFLLDSRLEGDLLRPRFLGVLFEVALFVSCFYSLALVCEVYLVPALESLCHKWRIPEDVAGCTLLALGAATPDAEMSDKDEEGMAVGVVMGSCWIAFLLIPGLCSLLARPVLKVELRPVLRDSFSLGAVLSMLIVFGWDGKIMGSEAASLALMYGGYVLVVLLGSETADVVDRDTLQQMQEMSQLPESEQGPSRISPGADTGNFRERGTNGSPPSSSTSPPGGVVREERRDQLSLNTRASSPFLLSASEGSGERAYAASSRSNQEADRTCTPAWPHPFLHQCCLKCEGGESDRPFVSIMFCFFWVAVMTSVITGVCSRWVNLLTFANLPSSSASTSEPNPWADIMGVSLLALGGQLPDILQSCAVSRRGMGGMALAGALGSQTLNICLGLGGPWALYSLTSGKPIILSSFHSDDPSSPSSPFLTPLHVSYFCSLLAVGSLLAAVLCSSRSLPARESIPWQPLGPHERLSPPALPALGSKVLISGRIGKVLLGLYAVVLTGFVTFTSFSS